MTSDRDALIHVQTELDRVSLYIEDHLGSEDSGLAIPVDSFADSIGINTHLNWLSSIWGQPDLWMPLFGELGIRHVRTSIGTNQETINMMLRLYNDYGAKLCNMVPALKDDGTYDLELMNKHLTALADRVGADKIVAIEGQNEPNSHRPPGWDTNLLAYQHALAVAVDGNSKLGAIPVTGPSPWDRRVHDFDDIAQGLADCTDAAVIHYYTGGRRPTLTVYPEGSEEAGGGTDWPIQDCIDAHKSLTHPTQPLWNTEMGWPVTGPNLPLSSGFITQEASAKYLLIGLAEFFARGVPKSYIYSLIDDGHRDPPRYHGLLTDPDLTKRKSFTAVKNLIRRINDKGAEFQTTALDHTLEGVEGNIRRLPMMQKRDGTFVFILWQDIDSYDRANKVNLNPPAKNVNLIIGGGPSLCRLYKPTFTANVIKEETTDEFVIPVEDELMIVEVEP